MNIPFNKPYLTGKETTYIQQAIDCGKRLLPITVNTSDSILHLPFYYELQEQEQKIVIEQIQLFFELID